MKKEEKNAKERILGATVEILAETDEVDSITVRQIADRAEVGIGSINYHYRSKENLLNEAVVSLMGDQAAVWYEPQEEAGIDPVERLKMLLKDTADIAFRYPKLSRITITHALLHGSMEPAQLILPILRDIFGRSKDEKELRLIAFQLITTTQAIFLRASEFRLYSGVNIFDDFQRKETIDFLVDSII